MPSALVRKIESMRDEVSTAAVSEAEYKADQDLPDRALGAYLGLAIGDALGATTEFMTPREIRQFHGIHRDLTGGGWLKLAAGRVTDDTEMSLALGRSIIERGCVDSHAVAAAFSEWMRSKPVDIGNTVRRGISHYRRTGEPVVVHDDHNAGNGACMRCLPIALSHCFSSDAELVEASRRQAHVTHNSDVADAGSEAVLRMVISALHGAGREALRLHAEQLIARYPQYRFDRRRAENPSGWIVETLQVVFQGLFSNHGFEQTLIDVVNRGGDADTTGAIAGMIAGALYGTAAIPKRWLSALDAKIQADCRSQAVNLLELARRRA